MHKIPTKFFGNPVKTKSELLYLHYQVFREWGKARCSGKHKGIVSVKQAVRIVSTVHEASPLSEAHLQSAPGPSAGTADRRERTHSATPAHSSWPSYEHARMLSFENDFGPIAKLLVLLCWKSALLYFWKVLFNQFSLKPLMQFSIYICRCVRTWMHYVRYYFALFSGVQQNG